MKSLRSDIAAKRRKKHKNQIVGLLNSICYNEQKSKFRLFTKPPSFSLPKFVNFIFKNFLGPRSDIRRLLYSLSFVFILIPSSAGAAQVSLAWVKSTGANVAGHKMHYGNYSGSYQYTVDVGNSTSCTISGLNAGVTYYFAATAYDTKNIESDFSNEVSYRIPSGKPPALKLEFGNKQVGNNWTRVAYKNSYTDPVVIASSFGMNGKHPAVIRIQNVTNSGFDIRIQQWPYISWVHGSETVSFLVMERGSHLIGNVRIEAGRFATNNTNTFGRIYFNQSFNQKPVLISSIVSSNDPAAVTGRLRYVNTQGFSYCMQEQQADDQRHKTEAIHYIAWEPSQGTAQSFIFDVGTTGDIVKDNFFRIYFHNSFSVAPSFLADAQTKDGPDPSNVRWRNKNAGSVEVQIDEEQSLDSETSHCTEAVGYIAITPAN